MEIKPFKLIHYENDIWKLLTYETIILLNNRCEMLIDVDYVDEEYLIQRFGLDQTIEMVECANDYTQNYNDRLKVLLRIIKIRNIRTR